MRSEAGYSVFPLLMLAPIVLAIPKPNQMLDWLAQYNLDWSYPRVTDIAKEINYTGLAPEVVGRVDITNVFHGAELNTEYLFGMFSDFGQSTATSLIGVPLNQTATKLILQGDTLYTSLLVNFNWTVQVIPVQFDTSFKFDDEGKVIEYDSVLVRSSWIFPTILPKLVPLLAEELGEPINTDPTILVQKRAAIDICSAHEASCIGENQQYESTDACMNFIMGLTFGDIWQAGQNTGICRYLHKAMVSKRPTVHCAHIGPSGGDMCTTKNYQDVVTEDPFPKPFIQLPEGVTWPRSADAH